MSKRPNTFCAREIIDFRWGSCTGVARRNCIGAVARAWVTSDYVTSVSCRIIRLPTALSCCWDNRSIRMDHYPGLDVPGTLEINACIMIATILFHRRRAEEGTARSWFTCPVRGLRESIVCHCKILLSLIANEDNLFKCIISISYRTISWSQIVVASIFNWDKFTFIQVSHCTLESKTHNWSIYGN